MKRPRLAPLLLLALPVASSPLACEPEGGDPPCEGEACRQTPIVLPRDAAPHDQLTEWWYYTGHLEGGEGRWGFQLTIFQYAREHFSIYMCHVAVIDEEAGVHYHSHEMDAATTTWTSDPIELEALGCHFELDGAGHDRIRGAIADGAEADGHPGAWAIDLEVTPEKPVVLHGDDGLIAMSTAGGESWYYSYTRLAAAGSLDTPDGHFEVEGQGWMDHQWGDFDVADFQGWDWWSVQLDDDSEVMLFQFRDWSGELASQVGTLVAPDGATTALEGLDAFSIFSERTWTSPHTDGVYPLDWSVVIPVADLDLEVRAAIDDMEMHNPTQNYWEGPVTIAATRAGAATPGVGFVELTGYAADPLDQTDD